VAVPSFQSTNAEVMMPTGKEKAILLVATAFAWGTIMNLVAPVAIVPRTVFLYSFWLQQVEGATFLGTLAATPLLTPFASTMWISHSSKVLTN